MHLCQCGHKYVDSNNLLKIAMVNIDIAMVTIDIAMCI